MSGPEVERSRGLAVSTHDSVVDLMSINASSARRRRISLHAPWSCRIKDVNGASVFVASAHEAARGRKGLAVVGSIRVDQRFMRCRCHEDASGSSGASAQRRAQAEQPVQRTPCDGAGQQRDDADVSPGAHTTCCGQPDQADADKNAKGAVDVSDVQAAHECVSGWESHDSQCPSIVT